MSEAAQQFDELLCACLRPAAGQFISLEGLKSEVVHQEVARLRAELELELVK